MVRALLMTMMLLLVLAVMVKVVTNVLAMKRMKLIKWSVDRSVGTWN